MVASTTAVPKTSIRKGDTLPAIVPPKITEEPGTNVNAKHLWIDGCTENQKMSPNSPPTKIATLTIKSKLPIIPWPRMRHLAGKHVVCPAATDYAGK